MHYLILFNCVLLINAGMLQISYKQRCSPSFCLPIRFAFFPLLPSSSFLPTSRIMVQSLFLFIFASLQFIFICIVILPILSIQFIFHLFSCFYCTCYFLSYKMFLLLFMNNFYSYIHNIKFSSQFNFKLGRFFFNKCYSLSCVLANAAKRI